MTNMGEFCPFTKAVEYLGDRWMLLIARELAQGGDLGFNALADRLPGISRSVLARRLRTLELMGLIAHDASVRARLAPYRLAPAGEQLIPTLLSFAQWAERWVPEDPAAAQRDPSVILWWLTHRVDEQAVPDDPVVLVFDMGGPHPEQSWLVLEHGGPPSLCLEDPNLAPDRYVYVEADAEALFPLSRGLRSWADAVASRSVLLYGEPDLVRALPRWFRPPSHPSADGVVEHRSRESASPAIATGR